MKKTLLPTLLLIGFMFLAPFLLTDYGVTLTTEIAIMAIFAVSLGMIIGYAGMVSLGHAAFFGIGAYTIAILGEHFSNTYLLLLISIVISAIVAFVTGAVFIRTSQFYFLMITLAFGQVIYALVFQLPGTGGSDGLTVSASIDFGFGPIASGNGFYYLMFTAFIVFYTLLRLFVKSPTGKIIKGIMENETRMKALGYNTRTYKLIAYTISGTIAGLAGSLYAYFNLFVSPDLTDWMFSGEVLIMVIIGGVGTLFGSAIGAAFYLILENFVSSYTDRWVLIIGCLLVILVLVGRGGIMNWLSPLSKMKFGWKGATKHSAPLNQVERREKDELIKG